MGAFGIYRDKHNGYYMDPSFNWKVMLQRIRSCHFSFGRFGDGA